MTQVTRVHRTESLTNDEHILTFILKDNDERFDLNTGIGWQPQGTKIEVLLPITNSVVASKDYISKLLDGLVEIVPFSNLAGRHEEETVCEEIYLRLLAEAKQHVKALFDGSDQREFFGQEDGVSLYVSITERPLSLLRNSVS